MDFCNPSNSLLECPFSLSLFKSCLQTDSPAGSSAQLIANSPHYSAKHIKEVLSLDICPGLLGVHVAQFMLEKACFPWSQSMAWQIGALARLQPLEQGIQPAQPCSEPLPLQTRSLLITCSPCEWILGRMPPPRSSISNAAIKKSLEQ